MHLSAFSPPLAPLLLLLPSPLPLPPPPPQQVYWRFGMQLSEDLLGANRGQDPIFQFKPWPPGGTTNSLSVASAASGFVGAGDDDRGNVRTRATEKRAGGKLDSAGLARESERKKQRPVVRGKLKEAGVREEEDGGGSRGEGGGGAVTGAAGRAGGEARAREEEEDQSGGRGEGGSAGDGL